ncbi:MAG: hypothetical protein AVDCRST_MAG37-958, partial [uncultured Rubrobacteraceae bacterium]
GGEAQVYPHTEDPGPDPGRVAYRGDPHLLRTLWLHQQQDWRVLSV